MRVSSDAVTDLLDFGGGLAVRWNCVFAGLAWPPVTHLGSC
jgi:hypothetical protein